MISITIPYLIMTSHHLITNHAQKYKCTITPSFPDFKEYILAKGLSALPVACSHDLWALSLEGFLDKRPGHNIAHSWVVASVVVLGHQYGLLAYQCHVGLGTRVTQNNMLSLNADPVVVKRMLIP